MKTRLSEFELCRKYRNENPHAEHVARLGLRIFDRVRRDLGLPLEARRLLEAACRLHDIGYSTAPRDHARCAAAIIEREGLAGFSPSQRELVAAAALLHLGDYRRYDDDGLMRRLRDREQAMALAAFVRIADGLDHGHVQDAVVTSVRRDGGCVRVRVRSDGYAGNVAWGVRKADLWLETFPLPIVFETVPRPGSLPRLGGVVGKEDSVMDAARRLLFSQYRAMCDSLPGTVASRGPEPLHDLRVAMRRFRELLRFFRKGLDGAGGTELRRTLKRLSRRLGPMRDAEVWMSFIESPQVVAACGSGSDWAGYVVEQRARCDALHEELCRTLESEDWTGMTGRMAYFLKVELLERSAGTGGGAYRVYAAKKVRRVYRDLRNVRIDVNKVSSRKLHSFRRDIRRGRYAAEFAAPALAGSIVRLDVLLKQATDALGDVHDMDVYTEKLAGDAAPCPPGLVKLIGGNRRDGLAQFERVWLKLTRKAYARKLCDRLASIRKGG